MHDVLSKMTLAWNLSYVMSGRHLGAGEATEQVKYKWQASLITVLSKLFSALLASALSCRFLL